MGYSGVRKGDSRADLEDVLGKLGVVVDPSVVLDFRIENTAKNCYFKVYNIIIIIIRKRRRRSIHLYFDIYLS